MHHVDVKSFSLSVSDATNVIVIGLIVPIVKGAVEVDIPRVVLVADNRSR